MPPPTDRPDDRILELKERWEADPSSRIFVQLADEYRRQGRLSEAIHVLEDGLKRQPNYLSAQVALGRCRLAAGDPEGALELLEPAVEQDPTHMVANKLLVEAYIETGRPAPARERLEIYGLMNDGDPDIAELRQRIEDEIPAGRLETEAEPPDAEAQEETAVETAPAPIREEATPAVATSPAIPSWPTAAPFGELWTETRLRSWIAGFESEGIFQLPAELVPPPRPEPVPEPAFGVETMGVPQDSIEDPRAEQGLWEATSSAAIAPIGEERAATVTLGQLYMAQGHDDEAERIFHAVLERDPTNRISREALAILESRRSPRIPGNETPAGSEARQLEEVGGSEWDFKAPEEARLGEFDAAVVTGGLTERKVAVLGDYLRRLRRAVDRDVP